MKYINYFPEKSTTCRHSSVYFGRREVLRADLESKALDRQAAVGAATT